MHRSRPILKNSHLDITHLGDYIIYTTQNKKINIFCTYLKSSLNILLGYKNYTAKRYFIFGIVSSQIGNKNKTEPPNNMPNTSSLRWKRATELFKRKIKQIPMVFIVIEWFYGNYFTRKISFSDAPDDNNHYLDKSKKKKRYQMKYLKIVRLLWRKSSNHVGSETE